MYVCVCVTRRVLLTLCMYVCVTRRLLLTFGVVHLSACFFWIVKENTNSPEEIELFLADLNTGTSVPEKYVLACYFIVTVCTTVGFGDIGD